ncbi:hypothetical protein [Bradyrhizobium macuxiense]|uniref:hypothetical protein n=1 Tax=Bradyrhizobium macuxiense TaxID=1755647 RepID=UPI0011BF2407|nr:hypothetical protein [Bradyrhizobium macuxiense]
MSKPGELADPPLFAGRSPTLPCPSFVCESGALGLLQCFSQRLLEYLKAYKEGADISYSRVYGPEQSADFITATVGALIVQFI